MINYIDISQKQKIKKILIGMIGAQEHLGDNIMKSGVVEAIRSNFPKSHISVCVKYPEVYRANPFIDKIINGAKISSTKDALKIIRYENFDLLVEISHHRGIFLKRAVSMMEKNTLKIIDASPQPFRDKLRRLFCVLPAPFTDGDIPIILPKTDEFLLSLRIGGLSISKRFLPSLFYRDSCARNFVEKLRREGFDFSKKTYILCESASDQSRQWGRANFVKFAKLLSHRNGQIIICSPRKITKNHPLFYLNAGIDKKNLFFLTTKLEEFFVLLGLNGYFNQNIISGIISGDTGALHAAAASNTRLLFFLRPIVICLGHNQSTGDVRYAERGTIYMARLKNKWNKKLEKAARIKMRLYNKKIIDALVGAPCKYISIDEPKGKKYLVRYIPANTTISPVFFGEQIYCHTLLRNIFRGSVTKPISNFERNRFYRRMNVKSITAKFVNDVLVAAEKERDEVVKKYGRRYGFVTTARNYTEVLKLENTYRAISLLQEKMLPRPIYFFHHSKNNATLLNSQLEGKKLINFWKGLSNFQKRRIMGKVLKLLKGLHDVKFNKFGKLGIKSNFLFNGWREYVELLINKKLKEIGKKHLLGKKALTDVNEIIKENAACLVFSKSCLIHHDIKIDNILVKNRKVSGLIDFEHTTFGPKDYEVDTILRSFEDPEIYFGKRFGFLKKDRSLIEETIKSDYPDMLEHSSINKRLKIYSIKFYLDLLALRKNKKHCREKLKEICQEFGK